MPTACFNVLSTIWHSLHQNVLVRDLLSNSFILSFDSTVTSIAVHSGCPLRGLAAGMLAIEPSIKVPFVAV
jgi:hypothetical protein